MSLRKQYAFKGVRVCLLPTVFHPALFFSTKYQLDYLLNLPLRGKRILELGAGSGLTALHCQKNGAIVTATDINPDAIESMRRSAELNQLPIQVILSNLFDNLPSQAFDLISINPPYYQGQPRNWWERAFYCGPEFEYFHQLFAQVGQYMHAQSCIVMVLSIDCAIDYIASLASSNGLEWQHKDSRKIWGEWNYIFELRLAKSISTQ
jgi:release factor glutamine methyltransferase